LIEIKLGFGEAVATTDYMHKPSVLMPANYLQDYHNKMLQPPFYVILHHFHLLVGK